MQWGKYKNSVSFWTPGRGRKGPMNERLRPSVLPSFCPFVWKFSWDWLISFFLKFSMVLGAHVLLCVTARFFEKSIFVQKIGEMGQKWAKIGFFKFIEKFSHYFFLDFVSFVFVSFILMHKSHIWEKSDSWDIGQNALGQSDCRSFKSTISLEQNDERSLIFCLLIQIHGK